MKNPLSHVVALADETVPDYASTYSKDGFSTSNPQFSNDPQEFYAYCYWYRNDTDFAEAHKNDQIDINYGGYTGGDEGNKHYLPDTFVGLGTSANPFSGSVKFSVAESNDYFYLNNHGEAFFYSLSTT